MLKKFTSFFMAVLIIIPFISNVSVQAESKNSSPAKRSEIITNGEVSKLVYYDEYGKPIPRNRSVAEFTADEIYNANYPAKYDSRDFGYVTSVKNQEPYGACWAFAYCSAAETSLIMQGFEKKNTVDLSEGHLAWFTGHTKSDILCDADEDTLSVKDPFDFGGNSFIADATLARGSGFAKEKDFPYSDEKAKSGYSTSSKYKCNYQLVSSETSYDTSVNNVKKAILESGSVTACYCADVNRYYKNSKNGYCYYCPSYYESNHMVTIVGWDDNFSADNFSVKPEGNGAWIVKNSWGTDWGTNGYFYLSFYDMTFDEFTQIRVVPAGSYDEIYQYDGVYCSDILPCENKEAYMANIFPARKNAVISAASILLNAPCWYKAQISLYTDLKDKSDPASGKLCETQTVSSVEQGYYMVNFNNTYSVKKGSYFSVVAKLYCYDDACYIPCEGEPIRESGLTISYASSDGQSFYKSANSKWQSTGSYGNVPVKAFLTTGKDVSSISIKTLPLKTEYYKGSTFSTDGLSLLATLKNGEKVIISSGFACNAPKLDTAGTKNVTITYGGKSVSFQITVKEIPKDGLKSFSAKDVTINYLDIAKIPVSVDIGSSVEYEITYHSNDPDYVIAAPDGSVLGYRRTKTPATVICTAKDKYGNTLTAKCNVTVKYSFAQWLIIILLFGWLWYI